MDLSSSPCRLRVCLLVWSLVTVGATGGEQVQEKELGSISSSAAMPLLASGDKNPGEVTSVCQYQYKPDGSRGLSSVCLCDGLFSLASCFPVFTARSEQLPQLCC